MKLEGQRKSTAQALVTRYLTPLGPMLAAATDQGVCLLEFHDRRMLDRVERDVDVGTHTTLGAAETAVAS